MFRMLLYICISLYAFTGAYAQSTTAERPPSGSSTDDSSNLVTDLAAAIENQKVVLTWKVNDTLPEFFAIERSDNGKSYELVTILNRLTSLPRYLWTDEAPKKGKSFYRIRYSSGKESALYSKSIPVSIAGYIAFKFYPNPVDHILIVRSDVPLDVQITDGAGKVRISEYRVQGLQTINVSALEKGIYLIRFSNKLTNVMSQEKLVKN